MVREVCKTREFEIDDGSFVNYYKVSVWLIPGYSLTIIREEDFGEYTPLRMVTFDTYEEAIEKFNDICEHIEDYVKENDNDQD